ncbi:MAG: anaerobic ribonucleoside-triphosphate reductase activating protein [Methanobacteriaceae archaeon]|jgi:pyruvate formate lyase activating enzyme|nr:anaerobic ribonucleoside-triphosphate reductase activating protein [Candidatus Methanorudis spinitermitis]
MEIGGNIISSVEYHGKISLVIFMAKCPLRCPYCHNSELLDGGEEISLSEIFKIIDDSSEYIDAVVVSGGEPLVQLDELVSILKYSKRLKLKTKLDTSAYYPNRLKKVLPYLDYLAIDVKVPYNKYKEIIGSDIGEKVEKSVKIVNADPNIFLECRTTYVPNLLTSKDIEQISREIECDLYTIQQFRNKNVLDGNLEDVESPSPNELKKLAKKIKPVLNKVKIKTSEFGEECI